MGSPFFPGEASTQAPITDGITAGLVILSGLIILLVFGLIVGFCFRYRNGSRAKRGDLPEWITRDFEIGWTAATLFLALFLAWWTAAANLGSLVPQPGAMEIHVVAKQWMWKAEHPNGAREINALHVPMSEPREARDDLAGRDPLLLRAAVPHQAGRPAGPLHADLVRGDGRRHLPPALHAALRHRTRPHGGRRRRDEPRGLRPLEHRAAPRGTTSREPGRACSTPSVAPAATRGRASTRRDSPASTASRCRSSTGAS